MVEVQKSKQVHQSKRMNASCFSNDLHNGRIAASWNPANLEIMNLKGGRQGSIRITTAVTGFDRDIYIPSWPPIEINPHPTNGNGNGDEWGSLSVFGWRIDLLLLKLIDGELDMCCFEDCWKRETKTAGIRDGKTGKQFMSGNWQDDWQTYLQLTSLWMDEQAGDITTILASLIFAGLGLKREDILGAGIAFAVALINLVNFFTRKPSGWTADSFAGNHGMGKNADEAIETFWSIVDICMEDCYDPHWKGGGGGPNPDDPGGGDRVLWLGG